MRLHVSSILVKKDDKYEEYGMCIRIGGFKINLKGKLFFKLGKYLYNNYSTQLCSIGNKISLLKDSLFIRPLSEESWEENDT